MTEPSWLDDELGVLGSLRQVAELLRAGFAHRWLMLFVASALALLLAGGVAFAKRDYAPRFVLRVVEAEQEQSGTPRLKGQLGEYVRQAIFTSQPLFELIRRHGLYPKLMRQNSRAALESFREDIAIEVYQNYFVEDRLPRDLPRTARLAVTYHCKDPELALAVTRDLGSLIVERELALWREQARAAANAADFARESAQRDLLERNQRVLLTQNQIRQAPSPDPRLQVQLVGLLGSLASLERRAEAAELRSDSLDLSAALERHGAGLRFEVVDDASLPSGRDQRRLRLLLAGSSFALGVPLLAMAIGAFDPKRGKT